MSDYLKPSLYNGRGQENQLLNLMFHGHDMICGCNYPDKHLTFLLQREKCHLSKGTNTGDETTGTAKEEETGIDEGDLERLFATENDVDEG